MENNQITTFLSCDTTSSLIKAKKQIDYEIDNYLNDNKFNYIVTADNISEVKKNNADINKTAKALKDFATKIIDKEMENVNEFKSDLKEYLEKLEKKRVERVEAIKLFEDKTKEVLKDLLEDYSEKLKVNFGLREEFDNVNIDDLVKLGNITGAGALAKGGKDGVEAKIQKCLALQNRYDLRVSNLKVVCYEKGLEMPLTENYVQGIIFTDDEADYQTKLNCMIDDEVKRLSKIKEEIEAKAQKEAEAKAKQKMKDEFAQKFGELNNKYNPIIDSANDISSLHKLMKELEQYDLSLTYNLSRKIDEKINTLEKAEQLKKEENVSNVKVVDNSTVEYNHTPENVAENITIAPYEEPVDDMQEMRKYEQTLPEIVPYVEDGKKIVSIQVDLQFLVKNSVADTRILDKVNEMLKNAGFSESIKSVNIIQGN